MDEATLLLFFFAPIVAGLLVAYVGRSKDIVNLLLSFSGAFLLAIAVLHVFPELYHFGGQSIGLWLLVGFMLQVILEFFSKGIEHGHAHVHRSEVLPLVVLISLCVHSFLEGLPFGDIPAEELTGHEGHDHGNSLIGLPLILGVLVHKLPVAIALSSVLVKGKASRSKLYLYLFLFAISFPLGALAGPIIAPILGGINKVLALAMGMLLHISMTIIFESSSEHKFNPKRFFAVLAGIITALLILL